MSEKKKIPVIIPDGIPWPSDMPVPEIEVTRVSIRKTKIGKDGKTEETTSTADMPVIPNGEENGNREE